MLGYSIQMWEYFFMLFYLPTSSHFFYFKRKLIVVVGTVLCLFLNLNLSAQNADQLFDDSQIHEIRFYFEEPDFWQILFLNYEENISDGGASVPYLMCDVVIDGVAIDSVGLRQRGKSSNNSTNSFKKPFKIDFNEFVAGKEYLGLRKLNLHNGSCDPAMMRDNLGFDMMRLAGVSAPRVAYCRLYLNDEFWGIYNMIEQIDKVFVKENFSGGSGNLYKNGGWSNMEWRGPFELPYKEDFELKTNEEEDDWLDFIELVNVINNTSNDDFPTAIQEVFNVDRYLRVLAIDIMTNNWDSYIDNRRNWYLYNEPSSGKFQWIPWDYNLSMGGDFSFLENPYQQVDTNCMMKSEFIWFQDGFEFRFEDKALPQASEWYWDFGDGTTSNEKNPEHEFDVQTQKINVCLTTKREQDGNICEHTRCHQLDLTFNPDQCESITNGTSPHPANDPVFQEVIADDAFCCNEEWDAVCESKYQIILAEIVEQQEELGNFDFSVDYDLNFPIILDNPEKPLIYRLMQVPQFRQRYLNIFCDIFDNVFTEERIFPKIDFYANLIREDLYHEPNFIFPIDYFEYNVGNGTGGGNDAKIPALKRFFKERRQQIEQQLAFLNVDCAALSSDLAWHDVTINEFMASNDGATDILDPAGEAEDWIELYNNTDEPVSLEGVYLSDKSDNLLKWAFPLGTVIQPNDYLLIWADEDQEQDGLHANFKLSKSGETLLLSHEDNIILDSLSFGEQQTNMAYARIPNGTGDFVEQAPTLLQNNELLNDLEYVESETLLNVFPNPAKDQLTIEFSNEFDYQNSQIKITDALGMTLLQRTVNQPIFDISIENLPSGIYFLDVQNEKVKTIQKVMIQ